MHGAGMSLHVLPAHANISTIIIFIDQSNPLIRFVQPGFRFGYGDNHDRMAARMRRVM